MVLSMLDTQIKLLKAIAIKADEDEIDEIIKDSKGEQAIFEYLIGEYDDSRPPDIDN